MLQVYTTSGKAETSVSLSHSKPCRSSSSGETNKDAHRDGVDANISGAHEWTKHWSLMSSIPINSWELLPSLQLQSCQTVGGKSPYWQRFAKIGTCLFTIQHLISLTLSMLAGHCGECRMYDTMQNHFYWPHMAENVYRAIKHLAHAPKMERG